MSSADVALFRWLPQLARRVPWARLGTWPTPLVEARIDGRPLWIKREGDSNPLYGGNKVRTLEAWLGHAQARGARRIWAIGAYGSNHAIATVLHARAVGLDAGAILFPQPASEWALENAGALIETGCPLVRLRSVIEVPFIGARIAAREHDSIVMPPGGATPIGTLGALSAALEVAEQVSAGLAPPPARVVVAAGSTCTTAGLLAGFALARALGAWRAPVPIIHTVRVTPWPVTSRAMILQLAALTLFRIARLGGPHVGLFGKARLVVDGDEIGRGYGRITARGRAAIARCATSAPGVAGSAGREHPTAGRVHAAGADAVSPSQIPSMPARMEPGPASAATTAHELGWPRLDGVYSGKAASALLRLHAQDDGPLLFWATKSEALLGPPSLDALRNAPRALVDWLR